MEEEGKHVQNLTWYEAGMQTRCAVLEAAGFCPLAFFSVTTIAPREKLGLEGPLEGNLKKNALLYVEERGWTGLYPSQDVSSTEAWHQDERPLICGSFSLWPQWIACIFLN